MVRVSLCNRFLEAFAVFTTHEGSVTLVKQSFSPCQKLFQQLDYFFHSIFLRDSFPRLQKQSSVRTSYLHQVNGDAIS